MTWQDITIIIVNTLLVIAVLMFCLMWFIEPISRVFWRWRNPPEKIEAERKAYQQRVRQPDWAFYEQHLQRPVPAVLRELYADHALILAEDIDYSEEQWLSGFGAIQPVDLQKYRELLGHDLVAIAGALGDDPIYLRPGPTEPNVVYVTYHDGGDTEPFAPDVETFVKTVRQSFREGKFGVEAEEK
jgi:hypothetical protein